MMIRSFVVWTVTAACLLPQLGCKPTSKASPGPGPGSGSGAGTGTTGAGGAGPGASEVDALAQKESAYVECLNSFSGEVYHGRQIYLESFPNGPQAKQPSKGSLYGPLALGDPKPCKAGVEAAKAMKPSIPDLESAGAAYVAAIDTLVPLTKDLDGYFRAGNYKDDKLAHAIELHPKLMAAYTDFLKADGLLEGQVDSLEDKIQADRLTAIEKKDGKSLRYLHLKFLIASKHVVRLTSKLDSPAEVDLEPYTAAVTAADQALTEDMAYYDAHKEDVDKGGMSYWTFVNPAKDFVTDAKDLMRRKRDKDAFSTGEKMTIEANNAVAVSGHPRRVGKSYNEVIDTSNRLGW